MARKVSVTINGKEYVSQESKKAGESLNQLGKTSDRINAAIKAGFVAAAAAVTAAVVSITKAVGEAQKLTDNIDKLSQKIGISRDAFQEWEFILSQNGMEIGLLQTSIRTLISAADEASRGVVTYTRTFDALGVSVTDANGELRDQESILFDTIYALAEVENTTQRTALATDVFGRSATELAPLLNSGADSIEALRDRAHELGLVLSDETIDAGVQLRDTIDQLQRTFKSLMTTALAPVMDDINELGQVFLDQIKDGGGLHRFIGGFVRFVSWTVNTAVPVLRESFSFIGGVLSVLGKNLTDALSGAWDSLADVPVLGDIRARILGYFELTGDLYEAMKAGDWDTFWNLAAPAMQGGLALTALLYLGMSSVTALWGTIQTALAGAGFLTNIRGLGASGVIAGLSIGVAIADAITNEDTDMKALAANIITAVIGGFVGTAVTGSASTGALVFALTLNFRLGESLTTVLENAIEGMDDTFIRDILLRINTTLTLTGDLFQALKDGDWDAFWDLAAPAVRGGIGLAAIISTVMFSAGSAWSTIQAALAGAGFLTSIPGINANGLIAGLSIVLAIADVIRDPTVGWDSLTQDIVVALLAGFGTAGLTGSVKAGALAFTIVLNFQLGSTMLSGLSDMLNPESYEGANQELQEIQRVINSVEILFANGPKSKLVEIWGIETGRQILAGLGVGLADIDVMGADSARKLLWAIQEELGIQSPSTEAMWVGEMYTEGLAAGLNKSEIWAQIFREFSKRIAELKNIGTIDPDEVMGDITGDGTQSGPTGGANTTKEPNSTIGGIIEQFTGLIEPLASVQALLDPIGTILGGVMNVLGPVINDVLGPLVGILRVFGQAIGALIAPFVQILAPVVEFIGNAFVWLYNKAIMPLANGIIWVGNKIQQGVAWALNGLIDGINWALGWLGVNIQKVNSPTDNAGFLTAIDYGTMQDAGSSSTSSYAGSSTGSSTSVQQLNINVYQYFQGNVIGDGGMESVGEYVVRSIQAYSGAGGNVEVISA